MQVSLRVHVPFALELVVGITWSSSPKFEKISKVFSAEGVDLFLVVHNRLQPLFAELPLEDLLFDRTRCHKSICKASLLLAITPTTCRSLFIDGRVPVWIEKYQTVPTYQVESAATR